jgi:hypothetical protein
MAQASSISRLHAATNVSPVGDAKDAPVKLPTVGNLCTVVHTEPTMLDIRPPCGSDRFVDSRFPAVRPMGLMRPR